jgi:DNA polymerase-3 subunit alpha
LDDVQTDQSVSLDWNLVAEMRTKHVLENEKQALGFFFSGHPFDEYQAEFRAQGFTPFDRLQPSKDKGERSRVAGVIQAVKEMVGKEGNRMAFVALADDKAKLEVAFFAEAYARVKPLLQADTLLVVEGHLGTDFRSGDLRMRAEAVWDLASYRANQAKCLTVTLPENLLIDQVKQLVFTIKQAPKGVLPLIFELTHEEWSVQGLLDAQWMVNPDEDWLENLRLAHPSLTVALTY